MLIKLADYVMQVVAEQGVQHVFMVPGGGAMHLNNALGARPELIHVNNHHEQASAIAAEAYARVTGNLGVALVTTGPGGTNALTGVAAAWLDSTPCLFLSGQVKRPDIKGSELRQLGVQELDIVAMVKPITKFAVTVLEPERIRQHLGEALFLARHGRPGPVWLDIPLDVQAALVDPETMAPFLEPAEPPVALDAEVLRVIQLLGRAERPVLLVGNGTRIAGASEAFLRLVELLDIPVLTTRLGVDLLPADHPRAMGMPGSLAPRGANFALQNSDLLLVLGARLDQALIAYAPAHLARGARKVMINIDPAELARLGPVLDLALAVDARRFIECLLSHGAAIEPRDRSPWLERCAQWKRRYPFVLPEHRTGTGPVSMYAFAEILSEEAGPDCIILPGNAGNASELFLTAFQAKSGQRIFHNKGTGAMGFCQPAAIGACLASGGKATLCVDGDGGFQMNIQELETVRRLGLPIKFFVMNNGGYASIRQSQRAAFGALTGADAGSGMTLPDVVAVAAAYGLEAVRIASSEGLRERIRAVLAAPGPVVCDVTIIPDEPRAPRIMSRQLPDGSMVSSPLEDLAPFLDRDEFRGNMIVPPLEF